ncbi:hypothetical protein ACU4GD_40685 [Cupriavidus basilensis]
MHLQAARAACAPAASIPRTIGACAMLIALPPHRRTRRQRNPANSPTGRSASSCLPARRRHRRDRAAGGRQAFDRAGRYRAGGERGGRHRHHRLRAGRAPRRMATRYC